MSRWTHYKDWEALPGEFRYKAVRFLDLYATDEKLRSDFRRYCRRRGYRIDSSVVDSFITAAYSMWGAALGPHPYE